jgi:uncharacterized protein
MVIVCHLYVKWGVQASNVVFLDGIVICVLRTMSNDQATQPGTAGAVEPLRARLSADLLVVLKARDQAAIDTLRCLLAVLDNAGAQDAKAFGSLTEIPRKSLSQGELDALMKAELISRRTAVTEYERGGRHRDAARLRAEIILIGRYVS